MRVALVRRPGETLRQLMSRLDAALPDALEEQKYVDEINSPRFLRKRWWRRRPGCPKVTAGYGLVVT